MNDPADLLRQAAECDLRSWQLSNTDPRKADALWKRSLELKRQASELAERLSAQTPVGESGHG